MDFTIAGMPACRMVNASDDLCQDLCDLGNGRNVNVRKPASCVCERNLCCYGHGTIMAWRNGISNHLLMWATIYESRFNSDS